MSLLDDIRKDRERPQVKLMSMLEWRAKSDEPSPGWVKVVGPCIPTQAPTLATDLNGVDFIARNAEARRIARVPQMEAALLAADELATDMMISIDNIRDAAKTDPRWEGVADKLHARLTAYRTAIGEA